MISPIVSQCKKPKSATGISEQETNAAKSGEFLLRRAVRSMGKTASLQLNFSASAPSHGDAAHQLMQATRVQRQQSIESMLWLHH